MNLTTPKTRTTGNDAAFKLRLCGDPLHDGAGECCGVDEVDEVDVIIIIVVVDEEVVEAEFIVEVVDEVVVDAPREDDSELEERRERGKVFEEEDDALPRRSK